MKILAVDTASKSCSVAIVSQTTILSEISVVTSETHSKHVMGMIESVINYKNEFLTNESGKLVRFEFAPDSVGITRDEKGIPMPAHDGLHYNVKGVYLRNADGELRRANNGKPFRNWRPALDPDLNPGRSAWAGITSPDDIWDEIIRVTKIPGTTSPIR